MVLAKTTISLVGEEGEGRQLFLQTYVISHASTGLNTRSRIIFLFQIFPSRTLLVIIRWCPPKEELLRIESGGAKQVRWTTSCNDTWTGLVKPNLNPMSLILGWGGPSKGSNSSLLCPHSLALIWLTHRSTSLAHLWLRSWVYLLQAQLIILLDYGSMAFGPRCFYTLLKITSARVEINKQASLYGEPPSLKWPKPFLFGWL